MNRISTRNTIVFIFFFLTIFFNYITSSNAAQYPNTSIAVIDLNLLLNESKVAIDADKQIKKIADKINEEVKLDEENLLNEQKKLIEAQSVMAPEAFEAKRIEYEKQVESFQIMSQEKFGKIDRMIAITRNRVLDEIRPILENIADEKGITVLLEKNTVLLNADAMDITKEVLKKLNKNLPKIKVELEE